MEITLTDNQRRDFLRAHNELRNIISTIQECNDLWVSDLAKLERLQHLLHYALKFTPPLDDESPFATMMASFDEAAREIGIDQGVYSILRKPDREVTVAVPVRMDDGSIEVFDGYRIQHSQGLGPFLGPLRLEQDLKVDELRALAAWMTWKCAVLGVPRCRWRRGGR